MSQSEASQIRSHIFNILTGILDSKGQPVQPIDDGTELLGDKLAIDSLDLATLVVQLTEVTGRDPFAEGFREFRTVGDLIRLYME